MRRTRLYCLATMALAAVCAASDDDKRGPSGFTGVRGKKSAPDVAYAELEKRAPSGFTGVRGKKPFPQVYDDQETAYKRGPSGFLGMRGKKDGEMAGYIENYDDFYKRAPAGFLGMRGKKENYYEPDQFPYGAYYDDKRAPSGFTGVRGKKDYDLEEIKRVPSVAFYGTRGKKQPGRAAFFDTRGKKYPYEFRGKFVGVRGKKMSNEVTGPDDAYNYNVNRDITAEELMSLAPELDLNQLMLILTKTEGTGFDVPAHQPQK